MVELEPQNEGGEAFALVGAVRQPVAFMSQIET
jgi:hypothetical protein